jgi:tRNA A-37 threonylcarbamoyl transferase component Bud32
MTVTPISASPDPDPDRTLSATVTAFQTLAAAKREHRFRAERLEPGKRIGHYEILRLLGEGGFSAVYAARHAYLNHEVALKTLRESATGPEESERFLREAQALALLSNPHVIRVYDAGMWEDLPYIILEKIEGDNLHQLVNRLGRFSVGRTMDLLEQLGQVLALQEQRKILHRDIKPGNVLQRADGSFCLLDYGLVGWDRSRGEKNEKGDLVDDWDTATASGRAVGTLLYMAPEQLMGKRLDHRTDLFLLGMTAWECLAGRGVRDAARDRSGGDGLFGAVVKLALEPVPPARSVREDVPAELDAVLAGLLAPEAGDRYHTASDFLHDLETFRYQGKRPIGSTRGDVFVAMPFDQRFQPAYAAIEQACAASRLRPRRMDQLVFVKDIWNQIVQEIEACAVVVVDFSSPARGRSPNPNVLTEAAHARAIGKSLIVLSQDPPERLPFDWRHMPVLRYSADPPGLESLAEQLAGKLRHAMLGGAGA